MAAFDWSPGGCCCKAPAWFDTYNYQPPQPSPLTNLFRRTGCILPPGKDSFYTSIEGIDWSIPKITQANLFRTHRSMTRDGRTVWASIGDGVSQSTARLACYDAVNKVEKFDSVLQTSVHYGGQGIDYPYQASIGPHEFATFSLGGVKVISDSGTIDDWGSPFAAIPGTPHRIIANNGFVQTGEKAMISARLEWPKFAGEKRIFPVGGIGDSGLSSYAEFFICDIADGGSFALLNNRVPIRTYNGPGQIKGFDYYDGQWAAVTHDNEIYNPGFGGPVLSGPRTLELRINGALVWTRPMPSHTNFGQLFDVGPPYFQPHICWPHETLGGGFVAVPEHSWTGNASSLVTTARLVVYRNGQQIWATPPRTIAPGQAVDIEVMGSTDRWIYFRTTDGVSVSTMTSGFITMPNDQLRTQFWLARHDGSEIIPMGTLTNTYRQMSGANALTHAMTADCMMRDSQAAPGTIPASYEEMWNARAVV